ncbi:MAG: hypothetical protein AAFR75_00255 [Pseudomonadota bacterium]
MKHILESTKIFLAAMLTAILFNSNAHATELDNYYNGLLARSNPLSSSQGPAVFARNNSNGHAETIVVGLDSLGNVLEYAVFNDLGGLVAGQSAYMDYSDFVNNVLGNGTQLSTGSYCGTLIVCDDYSDISLIT